MDSKYLQTNSDEAFLPAFQNPVCFREPAYTVPFVKTKPMAVYDGKDKIFALLSLAVGFSTVKVMVNMFDSIGFMTTLLCLGLTLFNLFYSRKLGLKDTKNIRAVLVFMLMLSLMFVISDNVYVKVINFWFVIVSNMYYAYSGYKSNNNSIIINVMKSVFISPFYEYGSLFGALFQKKQGVDDNKQKKTEVLSVVFGVMLSIPVCLIVMSLLMESDRNFGIGLQQFFRSVEKWFFQYFFVNIFQFAFSIPVSMYFFGAVYSRSYKMKHDNELEKTPQFNTRILPSSMCNAFLSPIMLIYVAFVVTQCSYLFSAYNTANESFDFSQYARSGFFELCTVSIINLAVISAIMFFVKLKDKKLPKSVGIFIVSFSALTLCLIVTAMVKMLMYIKMYGMTPLRIYTSIFMIYLFIMFVVMVIKQFVYKVSFTKIGYILAAVVILLISVLPVDSYIARYNLHMFDKGEIEWIGDSAMMELDSSAVGVFAELEPSYASNLQISNYPIEQYFRNKSKLGEMDIYSFNFTRYFAAKRIAEYNEKYNISNFK